MLLLGVTHVGEGEDGDGGLVRERQGGLRHGRGRRLCWRLEPVDTHRTRDVLQLVLAQVLEGKVETVAHLVVDRLRDEHAPRLGEPFEPCRDVDAVAVNPGLVVDDVPEVDADAEQHPTMLGHFLVAHRHDVLDLDWNEAGRKPRISRHQCDKRSHLFDVRRRVVHDQQASWA